MSKKKTLEEFIIESNKIHNSKYDYSKVEYVNNHTKVCIICPEHGEFWQTPKAHLHRSHGCPICNGGVKENKTIFIKKAKKIHYNKFDYSKVNYINSQTKVCIICPEHGEFWVSPSVHLRGNGGCPQCRYISSSSKRILGNMKFIQKAKEIHGNKFDYSKVKYDKYDTKVCIICPKHGEFWQTPDSHLQGNGCSKCSYKTSKNENEITDYIKKLCDTNIQTRNKEIITPLELDIYMPEKHLAIEYNGILWHSERFGKDKHYHLHKTEKCQENGIKLIQIFEDEYLEHKDIVKSKIRHLLNKDIDLQKVFARKCIIKEIDKISARNFLNRNHIQGFSASTVYLGGVYNDELVGVMTFKEERKGNHNWELTRFATDINKRCIGLGGKLISYFIRNYKPEYIKSFADRRWTLDKDNNLYTKLGFKLDKILAPDYHYVQGNKRIHKFNFRKQTLLKKYPEAGLTEDMTEYEMAQKLGFYRIWDCGLFKYYINFSN